MVNFLINPDQEDAFLSVLALSSRFDGRSTSDGLRP